MYLAPVSRASAPGAEPVGITGLEEYIPESLRQYVPTDPVHIFVMAGVGIVLLAIAFGGGIGGGTYRGRR